jgi:opacity protein-like surface antigen
LGAFADATDTGVGLAAHAVFTPGAGVFGVRLQMGAVVYGSRNVGASVPGTGGLVTTNLTVDNWLLNAGIGPQVVVRAGAVRPYAYALAGVGYFATDTTIGHYYYGAYGTTNYDDTTFAWSAGAGLLIPVSGSLAIDVGVQYVGNGTVRYLAEGDLLPAPGGAPPLIVPRKTDANLVEITVGVTFGR